jgi:imidazoleglycerol phosphate dehydratase HisB
MPDQKLGSAASALDSSSRATRQSNMDTMGLPWKRATVCAISGGLPWPVRVPSLTTLTSHLITEAQYKALALRAAVEPDPRLGAPSTKSVLGRQPIGCLGRLV